MKQELPLVTIAIPTYGQAHVLSATIESALAQDYPALEVLVVNDASPDATEEVTARFATDPRFRVVRHATNLGRVATYRDALHNHARGDYYLNLDGDDWLCDPTYIGEAARMMTRDETVVMVFARVGAFDEATGVLEHDSATATLSGRREGNELFLQYASGSELPHTTALFRREVAIAVGFYEVNVIGSDAVSLLQLLPGRHAAFVDREVAVWRKHGGNASLKTSAAELIANFAVADVPATSAAARGAFTRRELVEWRREVSARLGYRAVANELVRGNTKSATQVLFYMMRSRPGALVKVLLALAGSAVRRSWRGTARVQETGA